MRADGTLVRSRRSFASDVVRGLVSNRSRAALFCAYLLTGCGTFSWQAPLPTVPGPETPELVTQARGTLVWIDGPTSTTLRLRAYPSGTEREIELGRTPHVLDGPNANGWIVYARDGVLYALQLNDAVAPIVVARAEQGESFGTLSICPDRDIVHFASRRSVRVPGQERKGTETRLVACELPSLCRSSVGAQVSFYPGSIASSPAGGVACFEEEPAGERETLVVRERFDGSRVTVDVRGVSLLSAPSGRRHLVQIEPNIWACFDADWRREPEPEREEVIARPVDFASDECVFAYALPTAGHVQRYHRWWLMNEHVASYPLKLIRLSDGAHVTVLPAEAWACSFGPFEPK